MKRAVAVKLVAAFEDLGWNQTIVVTGTDYAITLGVSEMNGDQMLQLFGVLAPGGTPLVGINVKLTVDGVTIL